MARKVAVLVSYGPKCDNKMRGCDVQVIAASVGAEAKGTQTICVQLAKLSPVTTYKMIKSPTLVPLNMALCHTIATTIQATKYAELTDRCQDLDGQSSICALSIKRPSDLT